MRCMIDPLTVARAVAIDGRTVTVNEIGHDLPIQLVYVLTTILVYVSDCHINGRVRRQFSFTNSYPRFIDLNIDSTIRTSIAMEMSYNVRNSRILCNVPSNFAHVAIRTNYMWCITLLCLFSVLQVWDHLPTVIGYAAATIIQWLANLPCNPGGDTSPA